MSTETQIQQATPLFLQKGYDTPSTLYRIDGQGIRYYYSANGDDGIRYYPSVTSILQETMPMPYGLKRWYADMGWEEANRVLRESAHYGTFMHIQCANYLLKGELNLDLMEGNVASYRADNGITFDTSHWADTVRKDVLAFAQFCEDKRLDVIAIEIPLASQTDEDAGTLDIVAEIDFNKKRERVIIDMKSGRKGFFETHEIQLHCYRRIWNGNFPDRPVRLVFNWSPKDWEKSPTYNFVNQTDSKSASKFPHLLALYSETGKVKPSPYIKIEGTISRMRPIDQNYSLIDIDDMLTRKHLGATKAKADQEVADAHAF